MKTHVVGLKGNRLLSLVSAFGIACAAQAGGDLQAPFRVTAQDAKPIDCEIGHAAPFIADVDGDGLADLLVGQFGGGKLRVYKNIGTKTEPKFGNFYWMKAGSADASVPAG